MTPAEVCEHLQLLGLSPVQAAKLLGVGLRTMRRWTDPGEADAQASDSQAGQGGSIPGPAEQALRAWLKLHRLGLSWRPGAEPLTSAGVTGGAGSALEAARLASMLQRVRERGGPAEPWDIDLGRGLARLGVRRVSFCRVTGAGASAGFVLQSAWREDARRGQEAGQGANAAALEDASACIARRLAAERDPPRLLLALEPPEPGPDGDIELWDRSLVPPVVVRIGPEACAAAWGEAGDSTTPTLRAMKEARRARASIGAVAEQLIAQGDFEERGLPGCRVVELRAAELASMAEVLRNVRPRPARTSKPAAPAASAP